MKRPASRPRLLAVSLGLALGLLFLHEIGRAHV